MTANITNKSDLIYPELSYQIMGAIFEVHKQMGPGFIEAVYQKALIEELSSRSIHAETEKSIQLTYKGKKIGTHKLDLVIEDKIVIELKAVERFCAHHQAQLLSYLKASNYKLGILVNFSRKQVEYDRVVIR
ncbi:MAG: GxxExxY protein [bacterium]|nr:GxxExxY protein [bacterium]